MLTLDTGDTFRYEMIGEFRSDGQWIHPARTVTSYELIFVLDGTVAITEDGVEYELHENQMLLLQPGLPHAGTRPTDEPVAFYWFHFCTDAPVPFKLDTGADYYDVKALLKRLLHIANTPLYPPTACDAAGLLVFHELCRRAAGAASGNALANRITEYVRINSQRKLSVRDIANTFGYNPDHISKLFYKNFHVGLKEHIVQQRLHLAKDLLLTTNLSVKQIAARLDWPNENLFIKFFLYHEEVSPARFRELYCGTHLNNH